MTTTVRIDCGTGAPPSIFKDLLPHATIVAAEQETLLGSKSQPSKTTTDTVLGRVSIVVPCVAYLSCILFCLGGLVTLALFYSRVDQALERIDAEVPLTSTLSAMLKNVERTLNFTTVSTQTAASLLAHAHPHVLAALNSTTAAAHNVAQLTAKPVISLG